MPSISIITTDLPEERVENQEQSIEDSLNLSEESQVAEKEQDTQDPSARNADKLRDFENVYITKPPHVLLRDSTKSWYSCPWRLAQTFEVSMLKVCEGRVNG